MDSGTACCDTRIYEQSVGAPDPNGFYCPCPNSCSDSNPDTHPESQAISGRCLFAG